MSTSQPLAVTPRGTPDRRFVSQLTRNTFAMILEGERGSNLHELTDWRSKPAVAFGGKFRIVDFALSNCVNSGVRRVGVAAQYRAQSLIRHLQLGWSFLDGRLGEFIEIMPAQQQVHESQWYRGSADAVYQNLREIRRAAPDHVLVLSGDHVYRMDYGPLLAAHAQSDADVTLACIEPSATATGGLGRVAIDEAQRVLAFSDLCETGSTGSVNASQVLEAMGIYVFNADLLYQHFYLLQLLS